MANGEWGGLMSIQSYRDLTIWQDAISLAAHLYKLTSGFPKEELYGLTSQIRRSSASAAANIAEGHGREHTRTFIQFLRMAQGSLKEVETHLVLAERVGIIPTVALERALEQPESIGKRIRTLIRSLQDKLGNQS
ncbi:MAG: four helix bundle protein [Hyphomonadaceae bacterium]|nr:four helix bundle protein [Hyphomonadaceae bacterium]